METLESVFPDIPSPALQRVLDICDGSVETASEWILENNWRELLDEEEEEGAEGGGNGGANGDEGAVVEQEDGGGRDYQQQQQQRQQLHQQTRLPPAPLRVSASASTAVGRALNTAAEPNPGLTISGGSAAPRPGNAQFPHASTGSHHHHHHTQQQHGHQFGSATAATATTGRLSNGRALGRDDRDFDSSGEHDLESDEGEFEEDEDEDEDDDDDDDDDDEDGHSYYDSGDEAFFHGGGSGGGGIPPLAKRIKITREEDDSDAAANANGKSAKDPKQEMYWVAFDGQVVKKTLIELLNTTLSKLAHSKVTLLNKSTKHIEEACSLALCRVPEAKQKLVSVLTAIEEAATTSAPETEVISRPAAAVAAVAGSNSRNGIDHMLNDADAKPSSAVTASLLETKAAANSATAGQKRKRAEDGTTAKPQGFFAHFFSVSDLDMIWRSVMHAHLFNSRFGEMIEFHTASCGTFNKRDFDELMHIHSNMASSRAASLGLSPVATLKCCLILPCDATEEEIFRVGKHLHSLLKLQGSLYYRTLDDPVAASSSSSTSSSSSAAAGSVGGSSRSSSSSERPLLRSARSDLLNEDGKMTEDSFRRFARYRIKKEEPEVVENKEAHVLGPDHFLAYQQQRKVQYTLQSLQTDGWDRRLTS